MKWFGKRPLEPGDEVLTVASGFPTAVNPIIRTGCGLSSSASSSAPRDAIPERLREAVGPKTRAIMVAHTLGNPCDLDTVQEFWLVEDSCDALGSTYDGKPNRQFRRYRDLEFLPRLSTYQFAAYAGGRGTASVSSSDFDELLTAASCSCPCAGRRA